MKWSNEIIGNVEFENILNYEEKSVIANSIAQKVNDGDVIGFGSGSTSYLAVKAIAKRMNEEGLKIIAIPTSHEIKMLCVELGIPVSSILENKPDWSFDGADEVTPNNWIIKGRGAAMFKEKLNMANSRVTYILADKSKMVDTLGQNFPVPIECYPDAINSVKEKLKNLGVYEMKIRQAVKKDGPVITENNNLILDVRFSEIYETLEKDIKSITGVIESGLFIGYNVEILN